LKFAARRQDDDGCHRRRQQANLEQINDRETIGVALGSHGDNPRLEDILALHRYDGLILILRLAQGTGISVFALFRRKADMGMAVLAAAFNCRGVIIQLSACSAEQAIGETYRLIRRGGAKAMIAGGCEQLSILWDCGLP
jgi:3-oxoacyl-(acyl-carrier-protein) synthase